MQLVSAASKLRLADKNNNHNPAVELQGQAPEILDLLLTSSNVITI